MEAGKKAATRLLELQQKVRASLSASGAEPLTAESLAKKIDADPEDVYHILTHLATNSPTFQRSGDVPASAVFSVR